MRTGRLATQLTDSARKQHPYRPLVAAKAGAAGSAVSQQNHGNFSAALPLRRTYRKAPAAEIDCSRYLSPDLQLLRKVAPLLSLKADEGAGVTIFIKGDGLVDLSDTSATLAKWLSPPDFLVVTVS
jgi:hypothetical protein